MSFGARLKELRIAKGLTGTDLGRGMGKDGADVSKQSIRDWEKGDHFPKVDQVVLLCERLGCSADWLVFGLDKGALSPRAVELGQELDLVVDQGDRERVFGLCRGMIRMARHETVAVEVPSQLQQRK